MWSPLALALLSLRITAVLSQDVDTLPGKPASHWHDGSFSEPISSSPTGDDWGKPKAIATNLVGISRPWTVSLDYSTDPTNSSQTYVLRVVNSQGTAHDQMLGGFLSATFIKWKAIHITFGRSGHDLSWIQRKEGEELVPNPRSVKQLQQFVLLSDGATRVAALEGWTDSSLHSILAILCRVLQSLPTYSQGPLLPAQTVVILAHYGSARDGGGQGTQGIPVRSWRQKGAKSLRSRSGGVVPLMLPRGSKAGSTAVGSFKVVVEDHLATARQLWTFARDNQKLNFGRRLSATAPYLASRPVRRLNHRSSAYAPHISGRVTKSIYYPPLQRQLPSRVGPLPFQRTRTASRRRRNRLREENSTGGDDAKKEESNVDDVDTKNEGSDTSAGY
ncbi:hypothetical protein BJ546DRAFT_946849 [Cryomyces antarcticus]